ncbi:MAG: biotin--[acetyl-CoA-carboxylase] ligase [Alphaproteobacteria bacterium]|nr:biotin--[acetyl-CoA-carboxylase] ligase [Alphaproteobacteria bacterium]
MAAPVTVPEPFTLIEYPVLGSTNDEASRLAVAGAADGTVVRADRQSAGRGRRGRNWQSPAGNLYCSIVVRPAAPPAVAAQLSFVTAVTLAETLDAVLPTGRTVCQKWPNDVLIDGAKVAGILLESSGAGTDAVDWVVIGCGVNVVEAPQDTDYPATSLHAAGAAGLGAGTVLPVFLTALHGWRTRWETAGMAPVRDAWLNRAHGLGKEMTVRLPDREIRGLFGGMDQTGALLLDLADGTRQTISAGDVYFG